MSNISSDFLHVCTMPTNLQKEVHRQVSSTVRAQQLAILSFQSGINTDEISPDPDNYASSTETSCSETITGITTHSSESNDHIDSTRSITLTPYASTSIECSLPSVITEQCDGSEISEQQALEDNGIQALDAKLKHRIVNCVVGQHDKLRFSDICGLWEKKILQQAIVLPLQHPELFLQGVNPIRSILFYGGPGIGKTQPALAVAGEVPGTTFISVSCGDLKSKNVGESEQLVKELLRFAQTQPNTIIYLDEIYEVGSKRSVSSNDENGGLKTELLLEIETCLKPGSTVFVLGSTNIPWKLDDAVLRRFKRLVHIPLSNANTREEMFLKLLVRQPNSDVDCQDATILARRTQGHDPSSSINYGVLVVEHLSLSNLTVVMFRSRLSGADIYRLCEVVCLKSIERIEQCQYFKRVQQGNKCCIVPCEATDVGAMRIALSDVKGDILWRHSILKSDVFDILPTIKNATEPSYYTKLKDFQRRRGEGSVIRSGSARRRITLFQCMRIIASKIFG